MAESPQKGSRLEKQIEVLNEKMGEMEEMEEYLEAAISSLKDASEIEEKL
jgi:prefoldin subunit 5